MRQQEHKAIKILREVETLEGKVVELIVRHERLRPMWNATPFRSQIGLAITRELLA